MGRAERNAVKREQNKMIKVMNKLTPNQLKLFDILTKEKVEEAMTRYYMAVNASLVEYGTEYEKIAEITERANMIMAEEVNNELEEFEMADKLTREKIVKSARKHGLDGKGKKKIAKELGSTYSTIMTYVSRWKITEEDLKPKVAISNVTEEKEEDREIDEAAKKILGIIEGEDTMKNQDVSKEDEEKAEKIINEVKEMQCKESVVKGNCTTENKLQVLEEVKIIKVKGENGLYEAETGKGVILSRENASIRFENEVQLDEWISEFKEVFKMVK